MWKQSVDKNHLDDQFDEKVSLGKQFRNITWSHIRELLRFKDIRTIMFYLNEIPKDQELLKIINENKIILLKTENFKIGYVN